MATPPVGTPTSTKLAILAIVGTLIPGLPGVTLGVMALSNPDVYGGWAEELLPKAGLLIAASLGACFLMEARNRLDSEVAYWTAVALAILAGLGAIYMILVSLVVAGLAPLAQSTAGFFLMGASALVFFADLVYWVAVGATFVAIRPRSRPGPSPRVPGGP